MLTEEDFEAMIAEQEEKAARAEELAARLAQSKPDEEDEDKPDPDDKDDDDQ
jgi:hypothetical protein